MRGAAAVAILSIAFATAVVAACKSDESTAAGACNSGDRVVCACPSGGNGLKTCTNGAFGACECASSIPDAGSGGKEGGVNTADAGFGQYLGACNVTTDCPAGGECFPFGTKGNTCTHTCQTNTQCEPPSPKCNPRGVCAPPD
jgi:hypothetical protein